MTPNMPPHVPSKALHNAEKEGIIPADTPSDIGLFNNAGKLTEEQRRATAQFLITMDALIGCLTPDQKANLHAHFGDLEPMPLPQYFQERLRKKQQARDKARTGARASNRR